MPFISPKSLLTEADMTAGVSREHTSALCWDKAILSMHVQSWVHTWCSQGGAVAGLLPQKHICSGLCTLEPCTRKNQAKLSLGSQSAFLEGL